MNVKGIIAIFDLLRALPIGRKRKKKLNDWLDEAERTLTNLKEGADELGALRDQLRELRAEVERLRILADK